MSSAIVLAEAMRAATERLDAAGVASPRYDAEVLAACALDAERSAIRTWTAMGARVDQAAADDFDELVQRRCRREPLQHITGRAPFAGVELAVGPGVFIPRPESELLVQLAVDFVRGVSNASTPVRVVDLCAGSGAIGLTEPGEANPSVRRSSPRATAPRPTPHCLKNQRRAVSCGGSINGRWVWQFMGKIIPW